MRPAPRAYPLHPASAQALTKLVEALNVRGVRELALSRALGECFADVNSQIQLRTQLQRKFIVDMVSYAGQALVMLSGSALSPMPPQSTLADLLSSHVRVEMKLIPPALIAPALLSTTSLSVPYPRHLLNITAQQSLAGGMGCPPVCLCGSLTS